MKKLKWIKKFPIVKWWSQEAIVITKNSFIPLVITKGARHKRPYSLWVKSHEYKKTEKFIGNFRKISSAKQVAQLIYCD